MNSIRKYARDQFKSLIRHLSEYRKFKDPEVLHRARVDIKKIKSIILFLGYVDKKFKGGKSFRPFRSIFRKLGQVRDPEIHAGILSRYQRDKVNDVPDKANEKLALDLISDISTFKKSIRKQSKKIFSVIHNGENRKVLKYLKIRRKQIRHGLTPKPVMNKIHKTRKKMKDVIYLSEGVGKGRKKTLNFYKKMEELIGTLHDRQLLLNKLRTQGSNESVENVENAIRSENRVISKKIITLSRKYYL